MDEPDLAALRAVHAASRPLVRETPTMTSRSLSREVGGEIVLKAENLQRTGSFKLRGALAKLHGVDPAECRGVVTGSAGNHAQSLAYAARSVGLPCRVFMPTTASIGKVHAVEAFAGEVVRRRRLGRRVRRDGPRGGRAPRTCCSSTPSTIPT